MANPAVRTQPLTRDELARVFPDVKMRKAIENLLYDVTTTLPDASGDNSAAIAAAQATADQAVINAAAAQGTANTALANAAAAQGNIDAVEAAPFLTLANDANLPNERALAVDAKAFALADGGAGAALTLSSADLIAILPGDVADTSAAFIDATGLLLALVSNATYIVDGLVTFDAAAATTGMALGFTLPAGASMSGAFLHSSTTTTFQGSFNNASGAVGASTTASGAAGANLAAVARWIIKTAGTAGNAQLQFRTEVAASAITLRGGLSTLIGRRIA